MMQLDGEDEVLRRVALQNASSILAARQKAERELLTAQQALRESNERVTSILDSITDGFLVLDRNWRFCYLNNQAEEILRPLDKSRESLLGRVFWEIFPDLVGTAAERHYRRAVQDQVVVDFESFYSPLNAWFAVRGYPSRNGLTIYLQDITKRKQADAFLAAERKVLGMIAAGKPLPEILHHLALETESLSVDGLLCSVLLLDETGECLQYGAAPSLPAEYNQAIQGVRIGPRTGSCGTAAFERRTVIVSNIANDPLWEHYKELAAAHGLAACCSTPIFSSRGQLLGTIAMYYRHPQIPTDRDGELIELARQLASIAIERSQREETFRQGEMRLRATFNQAAVGIAVATLDGRLVELNEKFSQILGYTQEELREMTLEQITYNQDLANTHNSCERLLTGERSDFAFENRYTRKDGSCVWCLTTLTLLKNAANQPERFIGVIEDISLRREIEDERERLTSVLERSLNEIYIFDTTTLRFKYVNQGALLNIGYSIESMREMTPLDIKPEFDETRFRKMVEPLLSREKDKLVFQTIHRRSNATDYPVEVHLQCVTQADESVFLAVIIDITERRRSEEALRRSEEELRALANSIPQLAWMAEPNGNIFWYNRRWYEYTGTTLEEMQGWGWEKVHNPAVLPAVLERWCHSLSTGTPFEMEFPLRGADGQFRWFLTRVNPVCDQEGKVLRWFGTNTDVDEVRRTRDALRDESRVLELLNKTGTAIAASLDLNELVQTVTDAATQLIDAKFGAFYYNTAEEPGGSFQLFTISGAPRDAFEPCELSGNLPVFEPTFRGQGIVRSADIRKDSRNGQQSPHHGRPLENLPICSYLAVPVVSRSGSVMGGLFFGHPDADVFSERTERIISGVAAQAAVAIDNARLYEAVKQAATERKQLLEAERAARTDAERISMMKDEFLATLSHELRTPLNAILGWAQILATGKIEGSELAAGLETIQRNARAQAQLIEDLLDMSRIISGKVRLDVQRVHLSDVVEAAVSAVRPSAEAKGIRLRKVVDPLAGPVSGDPNRLQQVVWNLLTNAVKFTPKAGSIDVLVERVNSHLEVTVTDSGVGIPADFLPHVFERFRQADASTTRKHGGLGLGLSIVKQLVELHGGTIRVKSSGKDQGTTFTVCLPLAPIREDSREHPSSPNIPATLGESIHLGGVKVLVIDDEPDARTLIKRVLTDCNAAVTTAASADEGLMLLIRERPHVLISDIGMPEKDGYQFIREVRSRSVADGGATPAIALTAFARSEDRTRAMLAGYQVHTSKPIEPQELIVTVASLAGRMGKPLPGTH